MGGRRTWYDFAKFPPEENWMLTQPIPVTDAAFEKSVLQSELPVIVDFWADWCVPCKMVAPVLEKIAREYAGRLIVAKVDTDQDAINAGKYGVQGIPTMLFVANGVEVHRQVGAVPERYLRDMVEEFLTTAEAAKKA
ncbi:MAG TPA: thioredoxin [Anaerolineales bacterium]|nr:thioredoxin [Anaerolineales bacterium]